MSAQIYLELPPRLQAIADWVPSGARMADIGTDHGYLPIWLLQEKRIPSAIATDIGKQPLQRARQSADRYGVEMSFRQCDGLDAISPSEVDAIVIAGMGGETIIHILQAASWTKNGMKLLLQPMSKPELLRRWLAENGYAIYRERLVMDRGTIYPILLATGGMMDIPSEGLACYGYAGEQDPLFAQYLQQWINKTKHALSGLEKSTNADIQTRHRDMARLLEELEERSGERP